MSKLAVVIPVRNEVVALPHVITSLIQTLDGSHGYLNPPRKIVNTATDFPFG